MISKYKGAYYKAATGRFQAVISIKGKNKHLGYFDTDKEASDAFQEAKQQKTTNMVLNEDLVRLAKIYINKEDKINLAQLTGIKMSGVYNAIRGGRNLNPEHYDVFQSYILKKSNHAK